MLVSHSTKLRATSSQLLAQYDAESKISQKHEGQLTEKYGFAPYLPIPKQMLVSHKSWDEMAQNLPNLLKNYQEREALSKLPLLSADEKAIPDQYLARASLILGSFAHAYYFNQRNLTDPLPEAIRKPWEEVANRLGRPYRARTNYDNFLYDWRLIDEGKPRTLDNVELLEPVFNTNAERSFNLVILLMEIHFAPALVAMTKAQEAVLNKDNAALAEALDVISECLEFITMHVISKIDPNTYSSTFADPVIWARTVARFDQGTWENEPGVSGSSSPLFHALDEFTGRQSFVSDFGQQILSKRKWMPKQHVDFINSLQEISVKAYIENSKDQALLGKFQNLMKCYTEADGLLGKHMRKVYGYIGLTFKTGRPKTNGGQVSEGTIHGKFNDANKERKQHLTNTVVYASKVGEKKLGGDTYSLQLDIAQTGLVFKPGDICQLTLDASTEAKGNNAIKQRQSRFYSVTPTENPSIIQLTITGIGIVSNSLIGAKSGSRFMIERVPGHLFHLPADSNKPIVMFAMGNGIAPLLGFVNQRAQYAASQNWLYYTASTTDNYYYRDELTELAKHNHLNLRALVTQEKKLYKSQSEARDNPIVEMHQAGRLDILFEEKLEAQNLYQLLTQGAVVYICGKPNFSETIKNLIKKLLITYGDKSAAEAQDTINQWVADHRIVQDAFYATAPAESKDMAYSLSEVVQRNNAAKGYWSTIDGKVYDFTRLMHDHPGGDKILIAYAGQDATVAYQSINHHLDPRINNLLPAYYVGELTLPKLDGEKQSIYQVWSKLVISIVGMENNLANNRAFKSTEKQANYLINDVLATFINDGFNPHLMNMLPEVYNLVSTKEQALSFSKKINALSEQNGLKIFCNLNQLIKERHIAFMRTLAGKTISSKYQKCLTLANEVYQDLYCQLFDKTQKFLKIYKESLIPGLQMLERKVCNNIALQEFLNKAMDTINSYIKEMVDLYQNFKLGEKELVITNIAEDKPTITPVHLANVGVRPLRPVIPLVSVTAKDLFGDVVTEKNHKAKNRYRFFSAKNNVFIMSKAEPRFTGNVKFKYGSNCISGQKVS